MNRYLLAGCAVVALALGSGAANAQAKFEVKVGGDVYVEGAFVDEDLDAGQRSTEMRNRFRVNIIPSAKADNGLEYGGRIRMRSAQNTRTMDADRAYIFAQGGFGQVRLGQTNSFNDETIVSRPIDYLPFGLFDQAMNFPAATSARGGVMTAVNSAGGGTIVWPGMSPDGNATKVVYFSPRFAGLQLGASYTPRSDSNNTDVNRVERQAGNANGITTSAFQDLVEVGANYNATFGGATVKAGAGYFWGEATQTATGVERYRNLRAWQAGAQVGFAGVSIGGSYTDFGKSGIRRNSTVASPVFANSSSVWQAGAQYTMGPIVVGGGWSYGQDSGAIGTPGKRDINVYEIGASYTVAPGFAVQAQYDYFDASSDLVGGDNKGSVVILRTTLAF
jgi:predicted porin